MRVAPEPALRWCRNRQHALPPVSDFEPVDMNVSAWVQAAAPGGKNKNTDARQLEWAPPGRGRAERLLRGRAMCTAVRTCGYPVHCHRMGARLSFV